jgi:chromosomal replication initiator protein
MMPQLVVSGHDITTTVCEAFGITARELMQGRSARVVRARHMVWWLCRQMTDMSYPDLGRYFGRDHTTIIYGVRRFETRMAKDADLSTRATAVVAYLQTKEQEQWQTTSSARSTTSSGPRRA